jgi:aryl sulfotransferase
VVWSLYNHHANANQLWYDAINDTPGRVGPPVGRPPESIEQYFNEWLEGDGYPFWSFWENVNSWWEIRDLPNALLLHFARLKANLPGEIRKVAAFLEIDVDAAAWDDILHHCSFDYMKSHATPSVPLGGAFWEGGAETFINKGTNGRWRDTLSAAESAAYEQRAVAELGEACAAWLATGEMT